MGIIFSLTFIMNGYQVLLSNEHDLYQNGYFALSHFSDNMIGASKAILFCLLALCCSKVLKKIIGINSLEIFTLRIEKNYHLNQKRVLNSEIKENIIPEIPVTPAIHSPESPFKKTS